MGCVVSSQSHRHGVQGVQLFTSGRVTHEPAKGHKLGFVTLILASTTNLLSLVPIPQGEVSEVVKHR